MAKKHWTIMANGILLAAEGRTLAEARRNAIKIVRRENPRVKKVTIQVLDRGW